MRKIKKLIYYTPAAVYLLLSLYCLAKGTVTSSPYRLIWPLILILAGYLLSNGYIRGAFLGLLPSIDWLYIGLENRNIISTLLPIGLIHNKEIISLNLILGIFFTAFYSTCAFILYTKRRKDSK